MDGGIKGRWLRNPCDCFIEEFEQSLGWKFPCFDDSGILGAENLQSKNGLRLNCDYVPPPKSGSYYRSSSVCSVVTPFTPPLLMLSISSLRLIIT
jgi:hypothetical protein